MKSYHKSIVLILSLFSFSIILHAQNAIMDANTLFESLDRENKTIEIGDEDDPESAEILAKYAFPNLENPNTEINIEAGYKDNPFLGDSISIIKIVNTLNSNSALRKSDLEGLSNLAAGGGGMVFDNFTKGLTLFIVERFKEELSAVFFRDFKKKMEKYEDLSMLFPQTSVILGNVDKDVYQFNTYINELREAFVEDMQGLPSHSRNYLISKEEFLDNFPEIKYAMADAFELTDMLLEEEINIFDIFQYLGEDAYLQSDIFLNNDKINDIKASLAIANEILQSLKAVDTNEIFMEKEQVKNIFKNDDALVIYCGLQYQKIKHREFGNGISMSKIFNPENRYKVAETLRHTITLGETFKGYKEELSEPGISDSLRMEIRYQVFTSTFDILDNKLRFIEDLLEEASTVNMGLELDSFRNTIHDFMDMTRTIGDMGFDLKEEDYSSAIMNLTKVIRLLPIKNNNKIAKVVMKYGVFASEVAEAQTPEQAKNVIERHAMPVGGSSKKKHASFDISINSYMGLGGGWETLLTDSISSTAGYVSPATPVGISISKGFGRGGSVSLFVPLIDVGALAAYRLNDNDFGDLPELTFGNVFSPGGYIVYGVGADVPIALGFGTQMGPNLRKVNNSQFNISEARGFKVGFFLAVDIPIFSIYSKGR